MEVVLLVPRSSLNHSSLTPCMCVRMVCLCVRMHNTQAYLISCAFANKCAHMRLMHRFLTTTPSPTMLLLSVIVFSLSLPLSLPVSLPSSLPFHLLPRTHLRALSHLVSLSLTCALSHTFSVSLSLTAFSHAFLGFQGCGTEQLPAPMSPSDTRKDIYSRTSAKTSRFFIPHDPCTRKNVHLMM